MGILNNPAILRIRVPFQDFQPMEILNLELLEHFEHSGRFINLLTPTVAAPLAWQHRTIWHN